MNEKQSGPSTRQDEQGDFTALLEGGGSPAPREAQNRPPETVAEKAPTKSMMFQGEEFREIDGFPGYWVSIDGVVISTMVKFLWSRSKNGNGGGNRLGIAPPKIVAGIIDEDGYRRLLLRRAGKIKHLHTHIAVISTWKGPRPFPGAECRHLDGIKLHLHVDNLEWGTRKENAEDRSKHLSTHGVRNGSHKMVEADVRELRDAYITTSLRQLHRNNPQWSLFAIWAACSGYTWPHLPGAIPKRRKCTKKGWREGEKVRKTKNVYIQTVSKG